MSIPDCLLIKVLTAPELSLKLHASEWDTLIRQARNSQLLIRLATVLAEQSLIENVPEQPRHHLEASLHLADRQRQAVRWEVEHLLLAFEQINTPLVLLKGAAYQMAGLPPGRCRIFSDFDLLVAREKLQTVETALMVHGWTSANNSAYDQRYYRTWMHELPPMRHITRKSVIDVHHNLVPDTARLRPSPEKLLSAAVTCPGRPEILVLCGPDMILHSAVHLFHDGEFDHALRDLFDLQDLLTHFMRDADDWSVLTTRAQELNLARPLFYAFRYLNRMLKMAIPDVAYKHLKHVAARSLTSNILDAVFERGLLPNNETCSDRLCKPARFALYVRGHALRMPLRLLVPHLVRKALLQANLAPDPIENQKLRG